MYALSLMYAVILTWHVCKSQILKCFTFSNLWKKHEFSDFLLKKTYPGKITIIMLSKVSHSVRHVQNRCVS